MTLIVDLSYLYLVSFLVVVSLLLTYFCDRVNFLYNLKKFLHLHRATFLFIPFQLHQLNTSGLGLGTPHL